MKKVLIIGGANDIGKAIAEYFNKTGYKVVVGYHKNTYDIQDVNFIKCDVTKEEDINNIIKYMIDLYGNIDILINLANINLDNSFLNKTKDEFMRVIETNLVGTFMVNQYYSKYIDNGLIINMASTDGLDTGSIYSIDYAASKAGIINMSKIISRATTNKVLCLCPNWIDSETTKSINKNYLNEELKRIGQNRLISINEFIEAFDKIIKMDTLSGDIFIIDMKEDKLWLKKI